ncbi:hypothetical protein C0Q44_12830 [Paenibacillus sp. PCH8]|uniref:hypothetical protein n=1 Tax=Paenibacillus sp. PCH8 TaxID=2066524 RepID=UPI000CF8F97E|nr:hypothetical protein [Paenibacillus sp. PCH8]PQP82339.1 hypothetical protein C0Q44_12830 [Paenibacillus sp. PCH8]
MKLTKETGISLGFLAGTTFGSGIAFLFQFQSVDVIASVTLFGIAGAIAGLLMAVILHQRQH